MRRLVVREDVEDPQVQQHNVPAVPCRAVPCRAVPCRAAGRQRAYTCVRAMRARVRTHACVCVHIRACVCTSECAYTCVRVRVHECVSVHMRAYVHVRLGVVAHSKQEE